MLVEENIDCQNEKNDEDNGLLVMEPIVASICEAPPPIRHPIAATPQRIDCDSRSRHHRWVQHILRSEPIPQDDDNDDEDSDDSWHSLANAINMLQQRVILSADEATTAVADATRTRRRAAAQTATLETQATRMADLEQQVQALQQRNERLLVERRVLKKAYRALVQHSTVSLERYVEQALLQHEEQLVRCRPTLADDDDDDSCSCDFEDLEHLTTMSSEPPATPACAVLTSNEEEDDDDDKSWIPTALAVPYTPVRIVPAVTCSRKASSKRGRHQRPPMLSLEKELLAVERSGTPITTTSDTVEPALSPPLFNSPSQDIVASDPLMFRTLAIPMH